MLLAVDVGNTNIVFALFEGTDIKTRWRIATDARRTGDEYAVWLLQLLAIEGYGKQDVSAIIIGSVVPRAIHNLTVLAQKYFGVEPMIAGLGQAEYGFHADIEQPSSLGADRALNTIAAHAKYGGDLVVIDFGTATTFDAVDFNGAYKGGIIAPGINLSLDALVGNTAKLPRIAIEKPRTDSVIGRNTEDQMLIGVFWGYVAMMEGLVSRIKAEIGRPAKTVATGGLALLFDEHTDLFDAVDSDLTLEGLAILAERARDRAT
ncbi:type III pantothenate kinase [Qipengyuania pelagi]|jgi:type III pantothenate kinase|uniref:Type III pantothenate kinase n=1 Tax=Qipengyuania pelagi TaxID=994320 RepID=A0A844Y8Z9_9SPHN|nr:type III pantothenate kinase [Qipengyuania pelagi]MXO53462.1 type III pantothenate kinase [Qipengyuania pelagi]